ncbi:MAG: hypothetical protein ABIZ07_04040 [Dermatophilaceae bacterium]
MATHTAPPASHPAPHPVEFHLQHAAHVARLLAVTVLVALLALYVVATIMQPTLPGRVVAPGVLHLPTPRPLPPLPSR